MPPPSPLIAHRSPGVVCALPACHAGKTAAQMSPRVSAEHRHLGEARKVCARAVSIASRRGENTPNDATDTIDPTDRPTIPAAAYAWALCYRSPSPRRGDGSPCNTHSAASPTHAPSFPASLISSAVRRFEPPLAVQATQQLPNASALVTMILPVWSQAAHRLDLVTQPCWGRPYPTTAPICIWKDVATRPLLRRPRTHAQSHAPSDLTRHLYKRARQAHGYVASARRDQLTYRRPVAGRWAAPASPPHPITGSPHHLRATR
jgi:hypothetical protein